MFTINSNYFVQFHGTIIDEMIGHSDADMVIISKSIFDSIKDEGFLLKIDYLGYIYLLKREMRNSCIYRYSQYL